MQERSQAPRRFGKSTCCIGLALFGKGRALGCFRRSHTAACGGGAAALFLDGQLAAIIQAHHREWSTSLEPPAVVFARRNGHLAFARLRSSK